MEPQNVTFIAVSLNFFIKEIYFEVDVLEVKNVLLNLSKNREDQLVPEP